MSKKNKIYGPKQIIYCKSTTFDARRGSDGCESLYQEAAEDRLDSYCRPLRFGIVVYEAWSRRQEIVAVIGPMNNISCRHGAVLLLIVIVMLMIHAMTVLWTVV